jgi:hypothetical protein
MLFSACEPDGARGAGAEICEKVCREKLAMFFPLKEVFYRRQEIYAFFRRFLLTNFF